jgi:hypothetical protein
MILGTEKMLAENGDKIHSSVRKPMEDAAASAREALDADDADKIVGAMKNLEHTTHEMTKAMYSGNFEPTVTKVEDDPLEAPPEPEGTVIDAEFEEKH